MIDQLDAECQRNRIALAQRPSLLYNNATSSATSDVPAEAEAQRSPGRLQLKVKCLAGSAALDMGATLPEDVQLQLQRLRASSIRYCVCWS